MIRSVLRASLSLYYPQPCHCLFQVSQSRRNLAIAALFSAGEVFQLHARNMYFRRIGDLATLSVLTPDFHVIEAFTAQVASLATNDTLSPATAK